MIHPDAIFLDLQPPQNPVWCVSVEIGYFLFGFGANVFMHWDSRGFDGSWGVVYAVALDVDSGRQVRYVFFMSNNVISGVLVLLGATIRVVSIPRVCHANALLFDLLSLYLVVKQRVKLIA